jgi:hypothetical protein
VALEGCRELEATIQKIFSVWKVQMNSRAGGLQNGSRCVQNGCGVEDFLPKDPPKFSRGLSYFRPPRRVRCATKNSHAECKCIYSYISTMNLAQKSPENCSK